MRPNKPSQKHPKPFKTFPFDLLTPEETDLRLLEMADTFGYHMDGLHRKSILLENPKQKKLCRKRASDACRYTQTGIEHIKAKLHKRLAAYPATFGIMITTTIADPPEKQPKYDGKKQVESWRTINARGREFTNEINKWRNRHGLKTVRAYVKVLENQPGRNYPHLHIYFPGLKFLAPIQMMQKLWPEGNVDYEYTQSTSPANYITKYLSKMDGRDFMNLMLYSFALRLYSNSRGLKYAAIVKTDKGWKFLSAGTHNAIQDQLNQYLKAGYSTTGQESIPPRGS
jgi:hypothetical protein